MAKLDLTDFHSIEELCSRVRRRGQAVDMILMNAGVASPALSRTNTGLEANMAANHFGHFKMFKELRGFLEKQVSWHVETTGLGCRTVLNCSAVVRCYLD